MYPNIDPRIEARIATLRRGLDRRPVPFGLRAFNAVLTLMGANRVGSEAQVEAGQKPFPRNIVTDAIFGRRARNVDIEDLGLSAGADDLRVRLYRSADRQPDAPAILYMHGGGWVSGDVGMTDWWCSEFASRTGAIVVSLDYRLAPRHRFPAATEDCYRSLLWLHEQSTRLGVDATRIGVAGESAGGNLAAALCLLTRDRCGPRIAHQTLINPALDLTFASSSVIENADAPFLSESALRAYAQIYLGGSQRATDPRASPLLSSDISGLPPALIQVGEHDPLRNDGWRYALRLSDAGIDVRITEYPGGPHGFALFSGLTRTAEHALIEAVAHQQSPRFSCLIVHESDRSREAVS